MKVTRDHLENALKNAIDDYTEDDDQINSDEISNIIWAFKKFASKLADDAEDRESEDEDDEENDEDDEEDLNDED